MLTTSPDIPVESNVWGLRGRSSWMSPSPLLPPTELRRRTAFHRGTKAMTFFNRDHNPDHNRDPSLKLVHDGRAEDPLLPVNPAMNFSTISNFLPSFLLSMADLKRDPVGSLRPGIWIRRRHDVSCLKVFCHDAGLVGRGRPVCACGQFTMKW
jgi:hypothetical protein